MAQAKIKVRQGAKANLPTLDLGEFAVTTDTNEVFVGTAIGNIEVTRETDRIAAQAIIDTALATKAIASEVTASLALKADASAVATSLGLKADQSSVTSSLALKADQSAVTTALGLKADQAAVTTALALKAAATDVAGHETRLAAIELPTPRGWDGNNGYLKLPGGLIIQYGTTGNIGSTGVTNINFNVAFPTACGMVMVMAQGSRSNSGEANTTITTRSRTGFGFHSGNGAVQPYQYFAIGY